MLGRAAQGLGAENLGVGFVERRLEGCRRHVAVQDAWVLVIEDRSLDPPVEEHLGLAHEVLVERVVGGDEHRKAVSAAAGAPPLLAKAGHGPREADRDDAVQRADVDAELERVGRAHAEQLAREEPLLDLAPLRRGVAGSIRREERTVTEALGGQPVDQLRGAAALGEDERPLALGHQLGEQLRALGERAAAQAELLVEQRRVPQCNRPLGPRRGVVADDREVEAAEVMGELAGVRDRRRREEELRLRAVHTRETA